MNIYISVIPISYCALNYFRPPDKRKGVELALCFPWTHFSITEYGVFKRKQSIRAGENFCGRYSYGMKSLENERCFGCRRHLHDFAYHLWLEERVVMEFRRNHVQIKWTETWNVWYIFLSRYGFTFRMCECLNSDERYRLWIWQYLGSTNYIHVKL